MAADRMRCFFIEFFLCQTIAGVATSGENIKVLAINVAINVEQPENAVEYYVMAVGGVAMGSKSIDIQGFPGNEIFRGPEHHGDLLLLSRGQRVRESVQV